MTELVTGSLVLVVGASGVGKDTVIDGARRALSGDARFTFPRRYITRRSGPGEDHVAVATDQFEQLERSGTFTLAWAAHGLSYGIASSIDGDLAAGRSVVVNVSRLVVPMARAKYLRTVVVEIRAEAEARAERLVRRQRETVGDIAVRVARKVPLHDAPDHVIDNDGTEAEAIAAFVDVLTALETSPADTAR